MGPPNVVAAAVVVAVELDLAAKESSLAP